MALFLLSAAYQYNFNEYFIFFKKVQEDLHTTDSCYVLLSDIKFEA